MITPFTLTPFSALWDHVFWVLTGVVFGRVEEITLRIQLKAVSIR
ncbi:hypothetical protein [Alicyclobacillus sp. SO9]|nr:hypothetical protein [Alicyclobacillus sp. SO9]